MEEKNFSKKSVVAGQKILISDRGCIMGQVSFLEELQEIFRKYRNFQNYSIINI